MERKLLRSTHGTSPRAVKPGETLWYPSRNSHRGTATFLHHLVTFSCNCRPESDSWARASDRAQSKGQESTWQKLLLDKLRIKSSGNSSFISFNAHHELLFPIVLIRWLGILPCCRSDLHYWQQYFSGATSTAAFLYLQLLSMLRQELQKCSVRWNGLPCVALQVQLWWADKASHVSQVTADIQSTTMSLWGTSHGCNYHYTSLTTANNYSCLAFMKTERWFLYLAGQQYHHLLQNRRYNPRWQHFGSDKLSLPVSQFQGGNENRLKTI